jgi:hypothetical protein
MTKKPKPRNGSDWPGPRTVFRKLRRTAKKAVGRILAIKRKRKVARRKKK